ncbi:MAG: glucose-6-phosphate isomerase [Planctomycetes bacterium]|nr:glucose-6-phosphate isomerase [Planctomycetota bacterium]
MSVIRPKLPEDPIRYEPAAAFAADAAARPVFEALAGRLDAARAEAVESAVVDQPDRLLADYGTKRPESELFAILRAARRIRDAVDRVVMLGGGAGALGARAVFEACCHPFHNELPRGERGGRPRLSFEGVRFDNDMAQGLLDLVAPHGRPRGDDLLDRWAMIAVAGGGRAPETAAATSVFLAALLDAVGGDTRQLADRLVPIATTSDGHADLPPAVAWSDRFRIPDGVDERFGVFTAVGLLPASIVGADVVRLLEGAAAMNRRFREAPVADNPVLQYVAVSHRAELEAGITARRLSSPSRQLEAVASWYDLIRSERGGRAGAGAGGGTLITNLVVGECRRDRLAVPSPGPLGAGQDGLGDLAGKTWPELLAAAVARSHDDDARAGKPTADILLPRIDEHVIGQLLQMLMLATVVEERLVRA